MYRALYFNAHNFSLCYYQLFGLFFLNIPSGKLHGFATSVEDQRYDRADLLNYGTIIAVDDKSKAFKKKCIKLNTQQVINKNTLRPGWVLF
jgi:hypothetical protein